MKRTKEQREALFPVIAELRAKGLSQLAIANHIGNVSQSTVHYWMQIMKTGRTHWGLRPKKKRMEKIEERAAKWADAQVEDDSVLRVEVWDGKRWTVRQPDVAAAD